LSEISNSGFKITKKGLKQELNSSVTSCNKASGGGGRYWLYHIAELGVWLTRVVYIYKVVVSVTQKVFVRSLLKNYWYDWRHSNSSGISASWRGSHFLKTFFGICFGNIFWKFLFKLFLAIFVDNIFFDWAFKKILRV
jgi:hypothetical protein